MPKQRANERRKGKDLPMKVMGYQQTIIIILIAENVLPVISVDEENQQPTFSGTTVKYKTLVNRSE